MEKKHVAFLVGIAGFLIIAFAIYSNLQLG